MAARRRKRATERPIPGNPTFSQVTRDAIAAALREAHTALPARVEKYDPTTQTTDCTPVVRQWTPTSDGDVVLDDLPIIPNVPVAFPRGGGYSFQFPLVKGDHVWLVFNEADIARWRQSGDVSDPGDLSRHDISYPFAIPAAAPDTQPLETIGDEAVIDGPTTIRMGGPGADFVALGAKVDAALADLKTYMTSHTHPVPGVTAGAATTTSSAPSNPTPPTLTPTGTTKLKGE